MSPSPAPYSPSTAPEIYGECPGIANEGRTQAGFIFSGRGELVGWPNHAGNGRLGVVARQPGVDMLRRVRRGRDSCIASVIRRGRGGIAAPTETNSTVAIFAVKTGSPSYADSVPVVLAP